MAPGTSGNVLTSNGTTWTSAAIPYPAIPYDLASGLVGKPGSAEVLMRFNAVRAFNFSTTNANHVVTAQVGATDSSVVTVYRVRSGSTVTVLTATFAAAGSSPQTATISVTGANVGIQAGDEIYVEAPAIQDTTLATLNWTLSGTVA